MKLLNFECNLLIYQLACRVLIVLCFTVHRADMPMNWRSKCKIIAESSSNQLQASSIISYKSFANIPPRGGGEVVGPSSKSATVHRVQGPISMDCIRVCIQHLAAKTKIYTLVKITTSIITLNWELDARILQESILSRLRYKYHDIFSDI